MLPPGQSIGIAVEEMRQKIVVSSNKPNKQEWNPLEGLKRNLLETRVNSINQYESRQGAGELDH